MLKATHSLRIFHRIRVDLPGSPRTTPTHPSCLLTMSLWFTSNLLGWWLPFLPRQFAERLGLIPESFLLSTPTSMHDHFLSSLVAAPRQTSAGNQVCWGWAHASLLQPAVPVPTFPGQKSTKACTKNSTIKKTFFFSQLENITSWVRSLVGTLVLANSSLLSLPVSHACQQAHFLESTSEDNNKGL